MLDCRGRTGVDGFESRGRETEATGRRATQGSLKQTNALLLLISCNKNLKFLVPQCSAAPSDPSPNLSSAVAAAALAIQPGR